MLGRLGDVEMGPCLAVMSRKPATRPSIRVRKGLVWPLLACVFLECTSPACSVELVAKVASEFVREKNRTSEHPQV